MQYPASVDGQKRRQGTAALLCFGFFLIKGCMQGVFLLLGKIRGENFELVLFHGFNDLVLYCIGGHQKEGRCAFGDLIAAIPDSLRPLGSINA